MACKFCDRELVEAEVSYNGIKTARMMINLLAGALTGEQLDTEDGIRLEDGNILSFDNSSGEYCRLGVKIAYCPFCGRKLEEEERCGKDH